MKLELIKHHISEEKRIESQAKLTAKQIYEWGNEDCPHQHSAFTFAHNGVMEKRHKCPLCWNELLDALK